MISDVMVRHAALEFARRVGFYWDKSAARYRSRATGSFIKETAVRGVMERYAETSVKPNIAAITDSFVEGGVSLADWQARVLNEVKSGIITSAIAGRGGRKQMSQSDWGRTGGRIAFQARMLERFAVEIKAEMLTPAQIKARAALYARSARVAYYDGLTAANIDAGLLFEQRFLRPGDTCQDCIDYAKRGRVPIGTLPEPGIGSVCRQNCNCVKKYYKTFEDPE